jgi:cytochrome c-type biogenesis protein CcmF
VLIFARGALWPAIGLAVGTWLVAGVFSYLWARWGRGGPRTLARLAALPIAVWALVAAHLGAGVFVIGAMAETSFRTQRAVTLAPGDTVAFAGRQVALLGVGDVRGPNYRAARAVFRIERAGRAHALSAERRLYDAGGAPTSEVGIAPDLFSDLYIALGEPARGARAGAWIIRLYHNPMVHLIFAGAGLIGLGGLIGLVALARRRASAPAPQAATGAKA